MACITASKRACQFLGGMLLSALPIVTHSYSANEWQGPEQIFRSNCIYCHTTGVAPILFGRKLEYQYLHDRVRKGYGPMPAFKPSEFSDDELKTLLHWLNEKPFDWKIEQ